MEGTVPRTPAVSLREVFLRAAAGLPGEDSRVEVVAEALGYLQEGFQNHYGATTGATDEEVLVGDNAYASAVETIAYLDEPRFIAVASRMIRDGSGRIAAGGEVSLELWTPHLAGLLDIISGEGLQRSELRIRETAGRIRDRDG
jgi:hypothetical protein